MARRVLADLDKAHTADKNLRIFEINAFPWIGNRPIAEVTAPELLAIIRKVKDRGLLDTAHRLRMTAGQVFRYGIVTGRCERDIAADLRGAIPPQRKKHYAAITDPADFGKLLRDIWAYTDASDLLCVSAVCALRTKARRGSAPGMGRGQSRRSDHQDSDGEDEVQALACCSAG